MDCDTAMNIIMSVTRRIYYNFMADTDAIVENAKILTETASLVISINNISQNLGKYPIVYIIIFS